jgi:3-hydroxymyristoyl/3-hydroxydecanoyl-(acyl carrier protein) dehydratase
MFPQTDARDALLSATSSHGKAEGSAQFSPQLAVLRGHFPGNPLIPGVYTVALLAELARRTGVAAGAIKEVQKAKWSQPVYPGDLLNLSLVSTPHNGHWRIDGEVKKSAAENGEIVCLSCRIIMGE